MAECTETPNDDKTNKGGSLLSALTGLVMPYVPGDLVVGDYVFACRWSDADWNDPWAVGYVRVIGKNYVELGQEDGSMIPEVGVRGFRCAIKITGEQGAKIITEYQPREGSPFDESVMLGILSEA